MTLRAYFARLGRRRRARRLRRWADRRLNDWDAELFQAFVESREDLKDREARWNDAYYNLQALAESHEAERMVSDATPDTR